MSVSTSALDLNQSISIVKIFSSTDIVAQSIMVFLVVLSIWTWTIIIDKVLQYRAVNKKMLSFEETFWSGYSIDQLYEKVNRNNNNPMANLFISTVSEMRKNTGLRNSTDASKIGLKDRIIKSMEIVKAKEYEKIDESLNILSVIGSTAPFIGILGMVWSVMNNFSAIASAKNVTISVIAPSMSEALFVTAIGLFVAIPSVMFYSFLTAKADALINRIDNFSNEIYVFVSRLVDEGKI